MIFIIGFRRRATRLATIFVMCVYCHTPAAHALTRVRRYFTLFFIPVVPVGTKYVTTCTMCGRGTQITQEAADHYVAAPAEHAATSPGLPAPTSQPLSGPAPLWPGPAATTPPAEPAPDPG